MRRGLLVLGLVAALSLPGEALAQQSGVIVVVPSQQQEIERILEADNLEAANVTAREVADALARIPRGNAPGDFWQSYRKHVEAWRRFAEAEADPGIDEQAFLATERAVNATYDEAERVARDYGAYPPRVQNRWKPPGE